jgi:tetratricopeptide (TPR) repeat protein
VLVRLADIALYLGDFSEAQRYGRSALDLSSTSDASLRARCYGIVAATEYFGGDIQAAETRFSDALELLQGLPEADRDRVIHSTILANLGTVAETKHEWAAAEQHHREALRLRREIADARGALQSLHAWDERGSAQATATKPNATSPRPDSSRKASAKPWNARRYGTRAQNSCCATATPAAPGNSPPAPWIPSPARAPATTSPTPGSRSAEPRSHPGRNAWQTSTVHWPVRRSR